jgi:hypothetical protein
MKNNRRPISEESAWKIGVENLARVAASGGSGLAGGTARDEAIFYEHERIAP